MGGLFSDGEEATAPEDISKWTVDDVCSFVEGLSGCGEYTQVRGHLPKMVLSCSPVPLLTLLLLKGCGGHCACSRPNLQRCALRTGMCPSFLSHEYFPCKLHKQLLFPKP